MSDTEYRRSGMSAAERAGGYQVVPARRTGRAPGWDKDHETRAMQRAWVVTRHAALVRDLLGRGVPFERAWAMAIAIVAHYVRECGWGRAEWNYSVGNVRWTRGYPKAHLLDGGDDAEPRPYRAFDTLAEGVADAVRLAMGGPKNDAHPNGIYAPAWAHLLGGGDPVRWYDMLMRAGWHPWSQKGLDEFRNILGTVRGYVGTKPPAGGAAALAALLAGMVLVMMVG